MRYTMAVGKVVGTLFALVALTSFVPSSYASHGQGRKLFGGYRIVPKTCQPSTPAKMKSNQPAICMFNYECTRRKGEVVGACMDGFLFGACCQLPSQDSSGQQFDKITDELLNVHGIDHVPEIPILLNPDGTPVGVSSSQSGNAIKTDTPVPTSHVQGEGVVYTKVSTFKPISPTAKPSTVVYTHMSDVKHNAEKPQVPQADISNLEDNFPSLLGQQEILNDLGLPGLLTHSDTNNDIQDHRDTENPVTTLLTPDQVLQIADPVDQLPALFSQGLGQSNHSSADTVLLNANGALLNESHNPDELFKPSTHKPSSTVTYEKITQKVTSTNKPLVENKKKVTQVSEESSGSTTTHWIKFPDQPSTAMENKSATTVEEKLTTPLTNKNSIITQMYANAQRITNAPSYVPETVPTKTQTFEKVTMVENKITASDKWSNDWKEEPTTPMSSVTNDREDMVKVPTITYEAQSGNKKNDLLDKEEIAINHIISILNDTKSGPESPTPVNLPTSPIHTWVSIDETSKPTANKMSTIKQSSTTTEFPYTFFKPGQSSTYYNYETVSTGSSSFTPYVTSSAHTPRPSTQMSYGSSSSFGYSSKPTTNPPAPTVIVLGPLGTEFTTDTTHRTVSRLPTSTRITSTTARPIPIRTKKPSLSTTITHNISTIISGGAVTNNNQVVSTSYISVNLKDEASTKPAVAGNSSAPSVTVSDSPQTMAITKRPTIWTTMSTWSNKPSFHLKPSKPDFVWPQDNLTPVDTIESSTTIILGTTPNCDKESGALSDMVNFPPVRNPNITHSAPSNQQEKPTIVEIFNSTGYPEIGEDDIPTPVFIEDNELTNKVDTFVNKIVQSLQGNFQDLKDIVYDRKNVTTPASPAATTKRPVGISPTTAKPVRKPSPTTKPQRPASTTKGPNRPSARPTRPSGTFKPRPTVSSVSKPSVITGKPSINTAKPSVNTAKPSVNTAKPSVNTSKRPRPTKKPTTPTTTTSSSPIVSPQTLQAGGLSNITATTTTKPDYKTQCGVRPLIRSGRIVGGKGATFGEWPWQVLIREATWLGWVTKNKCGGVLITNKYVVTAAHCQPGFLASLIAVFGEFDISTDLEPKRSVTRNVRRVIVHRGYNPTTFENDLALLELETPVQFDEHIVSVCMPDDHADFTGRIATVTGWGKLKYDGGVPSVLQEVHVPIMENSVCQEMFRTVGHPKLIVDGFMCAGYANGQKDSCEGDSGGPLVMQRPDGRWILVGTVSHGIQCAAPYLPGVYMRMTYYKPWLHSITGV